MRTARFTAFTTERQQVRRRLYPVPSVLTSLRAAMADASSDKKNKRILQERRLVATGQRMPIVAIVVGFIGAGSLGAGTYGRWLNPNPDFPATALLVVGALGAAFFAWQLSREGTSVRVGDAGVALEHGSEVERMLWCDIERVAVEQGDLVLRGAGSSISVSITNHPRAVAWVLKEAAERLPKIIDVTPSFVDQLPKPDASDGVVGPIASLQTTGRRCAKSRKVIRYERDARLCCVCAEVYARDEVPKTCITCGKPLEGNLAVP